MILHKTRFTKALLHYSHLQQVRLDTPLVVIGINNLALLPGLPRNKLSDILRRMNVVRNTRFLHQCRSCDIIAKQGELEVPCANDAADAGASVQTSTFEKVAPRRLWVGGLDKSPSPQL